MDSCDKKNPTEASDDVSLCDSESSELAWYVNMAKEIPPGSLFDESHRPISPVDVRDFDTLDPISDYVRTPDGQLLDIPPLTSDKQPLPSRHDVWTAELDPLEWD